MEYVKLHKRSVGFDLELDSKSENYETQNFTNQLNLFLVLTIGGVIILLGCIYIISETRIKRSQENLERQNDRKDGEERKCTEHLISIEHSAKKNEVFL